MTEQRVEGAEPDEEPTFVLEDAEDALLEGDRSFTPGTIRAALAYRTFRIVFTGSLLSNVGTWMQNVVLAAFAYDVTGKASVVSLVALAQLGPLLALSLVGGALADLVDRKKLLIVVSVEQLAFSLVLAQLTRGADPSITGMILVVLAIGIGQAIYAPTFSALLPVLVARRDIAGAVSLNSANMNLSRVVGPAIGGILYATVGASWVFVGNAATYLFIIGALLMVELPPVPASPEGPGPLRRMVEGFKVAADDRVVGRCLITMTLFSFFCLSFVIEMPTLAHDNFGIEPHSVAYGFLYAAFGTGAVLGALSIGTLLAGRGLERIVRYGLVGFSISLTAFALLRTPLPAYPVAIVVGFTYFATVTSLATVLQERLDDAVRGRVMALWIMSFGGTVPIGAAIAGPIIDATSITAVVLVGAAMAMVLVLYADLRDPGNEPAANYAVG